MKQTILIILATILLNPVFGQRDRRDAPATTVVAAPPEGITYALPRTGIRLKVNIVKETFEPGPYAPYAEQLLGITGAKTRSSARWYIKDVAIETFSEPDPDHVYRAVGNASFLLNLTNSGVLAGINTNNTVNGKTAVITNNLISNQISEDVFQFSSFNYTPMYEQGDSTNNYQPIRVNINQKAAEAATRVLNSRLARYEMVAGLFDEFHPDGNAYKESLKELEKIETNYLSLFTGHTTFKEEIFSFDYIPGASSERGDVVFRISDENGVVPASDLSGKPVMLKIDPDKILSEKYTDTARPENTSAGTSGIYYRMPGVATINVIYELKTLATARTTITQFGEVAPVPEEFILGNYGLEFHTETGAIKSFFKK
ncbi:MAG: DUF4831 family protein [Bacteroidales bacterium]|jgi:hypothetical protein|nr:DUF4831 family protein [Bacteroidales bacterium]